MPYAKNESLPDNVKNALPGDAQSIYRNAYNSCASKYGDDEKRCAKIGWGAVKNAGYVKKEDKWIKENASSYSVPEGYETRSLAIKVPTQLSYIENDDGSTTFHNVVLLGEGTWTDNHSKTKTRYTAKNLEKMKIEKNVFNMEHDIFGEKPLTNMIGTIENARFKKQYPAQWIGDVKMLPTQNGKDVTTLLKNGLITDNSSELFIKAKQTDTKGLVDAGDIIFMGAATVRKGACNYCKFNEGGQNMTNNEIAGEDKPETSDVGITEKQLAAHLDDKKNEQIRALEAQLKDAKATAINRVHGELESTKRELADMRIERDRLQARVLEMEQNARLDALSREIEKYRAPVPGEAVTYSNDPVFHTKNIESARMLMNAEPEDPNFPSIPYSRFGRE